MDIIISNFLIFGRLFVMDALVSSCLLVSDFFSFRLYIKYIYIYIYMHIHTLCLYTHTFVRKLFAEKKNRQIDNSCNLQWMKLNGWCSSRLCWLCLLGHLVMFIYIFFFPIIVKFLFCRTLVLWWKNSLNRNLSLVYSLRKQNCKKSLHQACYDVL